MAYKRNPNHDAPIDINSLPPDITPSAKRYLELKAAGKSIQEIADICDKTYYTVYTTIRYWTDPEYNARRKEKQNAYLRSYYHKDKS